MTRYLRIIKNIITKEILSSSYRKNRLIPSAKRIVSFTFDDAEKSAFITGSKMFRKFNINATFYISLSFLEEQEGNKDLYSKEDIQKCIEEGHELGCHTYGHKSFFGIKDENLILDDLLKNQSVLKLSGINQLFRNFSYPRGLQTILTRKVLQQRYKTSRGITHGINIGKVDFNNLKSVKLYEHLHSLSDIFILLNEFDRTGGWLVFYTHDVQEDFSEYGCSPGYLDAIVKKCIDLNFDIKRIDTATQALCLAK